MFIKVTSSGGRRYAQLVESYRNDAGQPRQRTLATLGRLEPGGDVDRLIEALIPKCIDQNSWAHWRRPMDMMRHGCSTSLFQAKQQWSTMSS